MNNIIIQPQIIDAIAEAVVKKMNEPVLDKIRAEIQSAEPNDQHLRMMASYSTAFTDGILKAMEIIDRYREGDNDA